MSTEAERRREIRKSMFPHHRIWFERFVTWKPIWLGNDQWLRHTIVIGIPYVISAVIAYKWCECDDVEMDGMECQFPGCPAMAWFSNGADPAYCFTHDANLYRDWLAGEFEDVIA